MKDAQTFGRWLKQRRKGIHLTQKELAQAVGYAEVTLRKVEADELRPSRELAQRLMEALQVPEAHRTPVLRLARDQMSGNHAQRPVPGDPALLDMFAEAKLDWGEAPDVSGFQGRERELQQIQQWLIADQCRVVAVLGMGGIGKTALATYVAANVQTQYATVIWRSLRNAPPLADILRQWIQALSPHAEHELPLDVNQQFVLLMEYLRKQRCLLVLDNFETVLAGDRPGHYLPGYEGYGHLLKQIGEGRHQSCLLLTSREKPQELIPLAGERTPVRTLGVTGLAVDDGRALLQDRGLAGSSDDWATLHRRCSGNPLALKIVAETIRELFAGNIGRFLHQEAFLFSGVADLLEQQRARLSPLEQDIMFLLAVAREPVTPNELSHDLVAQPTETAVLAALHALRHRFLVERTESGFTLQNVVSEYFTATLIDKVCAEICTGSPEFLQHYALLKTGAKSFVRESQRSLILGPIVNCVVRQLGQLGLKDKLNSMLVQLRYSQQRQAGYIGGNVLNLMVQAGLDLRGQDFSQLALWQADLRNVTALDVNLRGADLSQSAFTDTFACVFALAFSPDGQHVAAATMGEEIRVWQVSDGKPVATWVAHRGWVRSVCFSPDGRILASAGGDQTVRLWDAVDGRLLATLQGHTNDVLSVCFSPDGSVLASGSNDKTIRLWDTYTGACLNVLLGHTNFVNSVCFSPDGHILASGSSDQTVRLWNPHSGSLLVTLQGHTGDVMSACFSSNGSVLASGSYDQTVRLWDSRSGECLHLLQGHTSLVDSVCFSPDGSVLASGSYDQTVRLWDSHSGERLHLLQGHTNFVNAVCFSPDGSVLASGSYDQTVRLWDVRTGECIHLLQGHTSPISSVCIGPDGNIIASAGYDRIVRLWDSGNGECLHLLQGHKAWIWSVCFSPDGSMLASAGDDQAVRLWDRYTGACLRLLQGHTDPVSSLCFSPNGNVLASAGYDQTVRLWDTHTGECLRVLRGHTSWIWSVCFNPDGSVLASGSNDETVRLWDTHTGECLRLLEGRTGWVSSVCFSPDGGLLASGGNDQMVRLWDTHTGECLRLLQGHTALIWSVSFGPDGDVLASGSNDQTVRLWDSHTGACLRVLEGHTGLISSVSFGPDGSVLASSSNDETIRLWNVKTGTCLRVLRGDRPYERMNITGATGLSPTQVATLKRLGAVEDLDLPDSAGVEGR
ncbi:MAG: NB-ARC domain-containing protein [Caldilineaceae bacterium]